jgi:hypothetical protein
MTLMKNLTGNAITKIIETVDSNFGKNISEILKVQIEEDGKSFEGKIDIGPTLLT